MSLGTKDRQRWQPEEDAILNAYVARYGPNDWNLISERMGETLDRDPKSCHERWKNYLKPGIKKGPLTDEEQELVIKLQTKYGNKWKRIAAEVPGRTAKRLGKWWEVYKERMLKEKRKYLPAGNGDTAATEGIQIPASVPPFSGHFFSSMMLNGETAFSTTASGICVLTGPDLSTSTSNNPSGNALTTSTASEGGGCNLSQPGLMTIDDETLLTLGRSTKSQALENHSQAEVVATSGAKRITNDSEGKALNGNTDSGLSLSASRTPGERGYITLDPPTTESTSNNEAISFNDNMNLSLTDVLKDLKENRGNWMVQKSRIGSKLRELKKQLEFEKLAKKRQKMEETEAKVRALKVEERLYLDKLDEDYAELVSSLEKDAELKETKLMESWGMKYDKLIHLCEQHTSFHGPLFQAIHSQGIHNVA